MIIVDGGCRKAMQEGGTALASVGRQRYPGHRDTQQKRFNSEAHVNTTFWLSLTHCAILNKSWYNTRLMKTKRYSNRTAACMEKPKSYQSLQCPPPFPTATRSLLLVIFLYLVFPNDLQEHTL